MNFSDTMQSWVGRAQSELLHSWGVPDIQQETRDGKLVLSWKACYPQYPYHIFFNFMLDEMGNIYTWSMTEKSIDIASVYQR